MSSRAKVVSFISASGGVGKTTLAILLAKWLIENRLVSPLKLLLVDLDPTAGLSLSLMDEEEYERRLSEGLTLVNLYRDYQRGLMSRKVSDYARPVKHEGRELQVLVPGEELELVADELWRTGRPGPKFLELMRNSGAYTLFDSVIFDSAPFFDTRYTVLSIYAAERYVVVLRPSLVDSRRTLRMLKRLMEYAGDFGLSTAEYLTSRFLGVINLARSQTIEADALLSLGFKGVSPSKGFNPLKPTRDERRIMLENSIEGLMKLIPFSDYVMPLKAEISRLELKDIMKDKDKEVSGVLNNVLNNICKHFLGSCLSGAP
jgi:chromosome partitioning protein